MNDGKKRIGGRTLRLAVVHAEGPEPLHGWVPGVGVTPFAVGEVSGEQKALVAVAVRAAFAIPEENGPTVLAVPIQKGARLAVDVPSRFVGSGVLDDASDFAPSKAAIDLVVVGHAHGRAPDTLIQGALKVLHPRGVAILAATFYARAGAEATQIPLVAPYLGGVGTTGVSRFAPVGSEARFVDGAPTEDRDAFQIAAPELRLPLESVPPNAVFELTGLLPVAATDSLVEGTPTATRRVLLPGYYPMVTYDAADRTPGAPVLMRLDTIRIDTDAQRIDLVWRGIMGPVGDLVDLHRVVVSMEHLGLERDEGTRLADTQRGKVVFALTEEDAEKGEDPPTDDLRLEFNRLKTLGEVAPEPRIELERYARISAELAEWPDKRAETLSRQGFDEDGFGIEERAWLERFASNAIEGQAELATVFGSMYLAEQDRLASPDEEKWTLRDYAGFRAAMEQGPDVSGVLEDAKMSLAQWMRLDRRWMARAEADPKVMAELEALLAEFSSDEDPFSEFSREGGDDADEEPEDEAD